MSKRKVLPAPPPLVLAPLTINELIENIIGIVKTSRQFAIEPQCAITVLEQDGNYCGAVLCMYTGHAKVDDAGKPTIELSPQFYPSEVASELQIRGLLVEGSTTRRTGISTTWCYFAETFV